MTIVGEALDHASLGMLLEPAEPPCVTLYVRTRHRTARDTTARVRRMIADVQSEFAGSGLSDDDVRGLLDPFAQQSADPSFWLGQHAGLAVFLAVDRSQHLKLPFMTSECVTISDQFHLLPVVELFAAEQRFLITIVDRQQVEVFLADRWSVEPVPDAVASESDVTSERGNQPAFQMRQAGAGATASVFVHGHGGRKDAAEIDADRYLRAVARSFEMTFARSTMPVVVGGDQGLAARLSRMLRRRHVLGSISARPGQLSPEDLHAAAWRIAEPHMHAGQHQAIDRYMKLAGTGLTTTELDEMQRAAADGSVDILLLPDVPPPEALGQDGDAALNCVLIDTLRHHGAAYVVPAASTPAAGRLPGVILRRPAEPPSAA